jgi:hypothetical protein
MKTFRTAEEVAEILRITPETLLRSWRDYIGYYNFPHRILFKQSDVEAFIKARFVPPRQSELQKMRRKLVTVLGERACVLAKASIGCCSCEGCGEPTC